MRDLFDILPSTVSLDNHCSREFWRWEDEVVTPILLDLGYTDIVWRMGEVDSWGPLSRVVSVSRDGFREQFVYG